MTNPCYLPWDSRVAQVEKVRGWHFNLGHFNDFIVENTLSNIEEMLSLLAKLNVFRVRIWHLLSKSNFEADGSIRNSFCLSGEPLWPKRMQCGLFNWTMLFKWAMNDNLASIQQKTGSIVLCFVHEIIKATKSLGISLLNREKSWLV